MKGAVATLCATFMRKENGEEYFTEGDLFALYIDNTYPEGYVPHAVGVFDVVSKIAVIKRQEFPACSIM